MSSNKQQSRRPLTSLNSLTGGPGARRAKLSLLRLVRPASPSSLSRTLAFSWSPAKYLRSNNNTSRTTSRPFSSTPATSSSTELESGRTSRQHNKYRRRSTSLPPRCNNLARKVSHPSTPNQAPLSNPLKKDQKVSPSSMFSVQADPFRYSRGLTTYEPSRAIRKESKPPTNDRAIEKCSIGQTDPRLKAKSSPSLFCDHAEVLSCNAYHNNGIQLTTPHGHGKCIDSRAKRESRGVCSPHSLPTHLPFGCRSTSQLPRSTPPLRLRRPSAVNGSCPRNIRPPEASRPEAEHSAKRNSPSSIGRQHSRIGTGSRSCETGLSDGTSASRAAVTVSRPRSDMLILAGAAGEPESKSLCYTPTSRLSHLRSSSTLDNTTPQTRFSDYKPQDMKPQNTINISGARGDANGLSLTQGISKSALPSVLPSYVERGAVACPDEDENSAHLTTIQIPSPYSRHPSTQDVFCGQIFGFGTFNVIPESPPPTARPMGNYTVERPLAYELPAPASARHPTRRRGLILDNLTVPLLIETVPASENESEVDSQIDVGVQRGSGGTLNDVFPDSDDITYGIVADGDYSPVSEALESYFDAFDTSTGTIKPELEFAPPNEPRTASTVNQMNCSPSRPFTPLQTIFLKSQTQSSSSSCILDSSSCDSTSLSCETPISTSDLSSPPVWTPSTTQLLSEILPASTSHSSLLRPVPGSSRSPSRYNTPPRTPSPLRLEITPSPTSQARLGLRLPGSSETTDIEGNSFSSMSVTARTAAMRAATWAAQRSARVKEVLSSRREKRQMGYSLSEVNSQSLSLRPGGGEYGRGSRPGKFTHMMPIDFSTRASAHKHCLSRNVNNPRSRQKAASSVEVVTSLPKAMARSTLTNDILPTTHAS